MSVLNFQICGGPSSGMSTVAKSMKIELLNKAKIQVEIINMIDFYVPIRGSLRRNRSRAGSLKGDEKTDSETSAKIHQEIVIIDSEIDFDDPRQVDYDLLVKGLRHLIEERQPFNKPVYDRYLKIRTFNTVPV